MGSATSLDTHNRETPGAQRQLKSWGGTKVWVVSTPGRLCSAPAVFGQAGCWVRERVVPPAVRVWGYHHWKIFENSDAKSCILMTICCEISCFLKTTTKKLGGTIYRWSPNLKVGGPVSPSPYDCCIYVKRTTFFLQQVSRELFCRSEAHWM